MTSLFEIMEGATPVGVLGFESHGARQVGRFRYASSWIETGHELEPGLPLSGDDVFYSDPEDPRHAYPMSLADTAPDSWGRRIVRRARNGSACEADYLLSVTDVFRMGSLSVRPSGTAAASNSVPSSRDLTKLQRLVDNFEAGDRLDEDAMALLLSSATALGGARPKCSIVDDGEVSLVKFTSLNDSVNVEAAEVLALSLASRCGIEAARAKLVRIDGRPAAMLRRFDRHGTRRIGYISARTMLGLRDAASGTYVDLADAIRSRSADPVADTTELFRRVAFGILVSNTDDHTKNHGFLHVGGGKWRLAPAFDINPAPDRHRHLKTAISSISGSAADIEALVDHAGLFEVDADRAVGIVRAIAETISAGWRDIAARLGMSGKDVAHYRGAFEHSEMVKASRLAAGSTPAPK